STIYAFSGKAGRWDVLKLAADHKPQWSADRDDATVQDGDDFYVFSGATGRWSSPKGSPTVEEAPIEEQVETKILHLQQLQAAEAHRIAQELYHRSVQS